MSSVSPTRLPARERKQAIVDAALAVFSSTSYACATTAEIARQARVSEPVIYRHFASKRELWCACLDQAWAWFREAIEARFGALGATDGVLAVGPQGLRLRRQRVLMPNLWLQGATEAAGDPEIRRVVRLHMREAHAFVAGVVRRAQAAGGVPADRDAEAEAWVVLAGSLLLALADRLGGVLSAADLAAISRERHRWLLGRP